VPTKKQAGQRASGLWKVAGATPVGVFLILMAILVGHDSGSTHESPILLAFLNTILFCGTLLVVVLMATRSYGMTGSLTFLMMGCGALFLGVGSLMAGWVMPASGNPNPSVTLFNLGCLFAGFCHLASAHYLLADLVGTHPPETRPPHVAIPYAGIVVFFCVVAPLAVQGRLPVFFVPGAGTSLLRQFVLGGALLMFALSGLMFVGIYSALKTAFAYWYGLALLLVAVGLVCLLFLTTVGGTLGWVGRSAQYLGSVYFIFALLAGRREMDQASLSATITTRRGLWPYLEQKVKERTLALETENEDLLKEIAERRQAEKDLRRSETKFRTLFDSTSDAVMLMTGHSFFDCNQATLAIFGCATREEFCSKHPADVSPPMQPDGTDSRTLANQQIAIAMEKGRHQFEWMHKRADTGEVFSADVLLSAMELDGKRVLQATVRDITERKQAEEAVSKAQAMQRATFDSTSDFICSVDPQGFGLLTFNRAFRDYYLQQRGIRIHVGQRPEDLLPSAAHIEQWRGYFQRALASGPFTTESLASSGKVTLLLTFNLLKHGESIFGVSVFGKDITERKQTEEDLRASHEQLRALAARVQAVREEERTRVAREIHDVLAQELTSLKVDVTLLTRLLAQSPGELEQSLVREKLRGMAIATDAAIQSVQEIATSLRPVVLDSLGLGAAIEWQVGDFQARTGISCKARLPSKDLLLDRDHSTALFRILQESLTNVARHAAATQVEILLQRKAEYVNLTIQDNGRGIQECQANAPGAIGLLGLRERALLLGGRCDISGRPGEGTRVEVRIPLPQQGNSEDKQL